MDIFSDSSWREAFELVISTERFGPFTLTANVDLQAIELLFRRVEDAQARFRGSPLAQVANDLEREVVVSSVVGTNTIEGGELTIEQTQLAFELDPETVQEEQQRRVVNIKAAYDLAKNMASKPGWQPDVEYVKDLHRLITLGVSDSHNIPGQLRDNPKNTVTRVGDTEHGGIYKPPQNGRDIAELLKALLVWNASMAERGIPALIRAPLCHVDQRGIVKHDVRRHSGAFGEPAPARAQNIEKRRARRVEHRLDRRAACAAASGSGGFRIAAQLQRFLAFQ